MALDHITMLALVGQMLRGGARHGRRPLVSWRLWTLCMIFARIAFLQLSKGDYSANDAVVVLTEQNFEQQVLQSSDYWLVEFYAPWSVETCAWWSVPLVCSNIHGVWLMMTRQVWPLPETRAGVQGRGQEAQVTGDY